MTKGLGVKRETPEKVLLTRHDIGFDIFALPEISNVIELKLFV